MKIVVQNNLGILEGDYDQKKLIDSLTFISETERKAYYIRLNRQIRRLKPKHGEAQARKLAKSFVPENINPRVLSDGKKFPIGLIDTVLELFPDSEFEIDDQRSDNGCNLSSIIKPHKSIPPLRDYQKEAIETACIEKNGIIGIGTAGGKTRIAIETIIRLGKSFLFCTSRDKLATQFALDIYEYVFGNPINIEETSNSKATYQNRIKKILLEKLGIGIKCEGENGVITTYHSLNKFAKDERYGTIIADECHHVAAPNFLKNVAMCIARNRIGMSASIGDRGDKLDILNQAFIGPLIYRKKHHQLREENYVSEIEVQMWPFDHIWEGEEYDKPADIDKYCIVENIKRNRFIVSILSNLSPNPVLVFVKQIRHGEIIKEMCLRNNIPAQFFCAENQNSDLESWIRNPKGVVIATKILDTGMNSPTLQYALNAAGGRSAISAEQQSGRIVRKTFKKDFAEYIDIADKNHRILSSQCIERVKKYMQLGYKVTHINKEVAENLSPPSVTNNFEINI